MTSKTFEILDRGTTIAALAVRLDPGCEADRRLLSRAGFGSLAAIQSTYIVVGRLSDLGQGGRATYDPYDWSDTTMQEAHRHIQDHFDELGAGAVVDVEYLRGATSVPKVSEFGPPSPASPPRT